MPPVWHGQHPRALRLAPRSGPRGRGLRTPNTSAGVHHSTRSESDSATRHPTWHARRESASSVLYGSVDAAGILTRSTHRPIRPVACSGPKSGAMTSRDSEVKTPRVSWLCQPSRASLMSCNRNDDWNPCRGQSVEAYKIWQEGIARRIRRTRILVRELSRGASSPAESIRPNWQLLQPRQEHLARSPPRSPCDAGSERIAASRRISNWPVGCLSDLYSAGASGSTPRKAADVRFDDRRT